jgi:alpha-ketoglutarate-dependent taurine dioxygenase
LITAISAVITAIHTDTARPGTEPSTTNFAVRQLAHYFKVFPLVTGSGQPQDLSAVAATGPGNTTPAWLPTWTTRDWFAGVTQQPAGSSLAALAAALTAANATATDTVLALANIRQQLAAVRQELAATRAGGAENEGCWLSTEEIPEFSGDMADFVVWRQRVTLLVVAR